jgi:hypothetical protein
LDSVSQVAVLIIRAWCEPDRTFRARLVDLGDPSAGERTVAVASGPDEVVRAVEEWVRSVALAPGHPA